MEKQINSNIGIALTVAVIIVLIVAFFSGCGSQPKQAAVAPAPVPNYRYATVVLAPSPTAVAPNYQQPVECPKCDAENALPQEFNYNMALRCSRCGASFPLLETAIARNDGYGRKGMGMYQQGQKPYQGPAVLRRGYFSNSNYYSNYLYKNDSNFNISPDGLSGSMSNTNIRIHEYGRVSDSGTIVGPGAFSRYGGY